MTEATATNDGQRVHYVDHGGDGPVVLLLHSFLMDTEMFAPQVAALGADFHLVALDARGHGGTPADGPFDYWAVARDALAVLDELDVAEAAVIGTSQGGFVGLRLALLAPDRIRALAVLGTSAAAEDPAVADAYRQFARTWAEQGPTEQLMSVFAQICLGEMDATEWKAKWRTVSAERLNTVLDALVGRDDIRDRLPEINCPTLVLHGLADNAYPLERATEITNGVPKAEPLVKVEHGAHFLSLTQPNTVNPRLSAFLKAHA